MSAFCEASLIEIAPVVKSKGAGRLWQVTIVESRCWAASAWLAGTISGRAGCGHHPAYALWNHRRLDAFPAGENAAESLGVPVERTRKTTFLLAAFSTAIHVSVGRSSATVIDSAMTASAWLPSLFFGSGAMRHLEW
ncbi:hypothetical protein X766_19610 [Mesorhizobium sp. LSJC255A00]|nr:hypothetical protein X766_19610 [Mesorhizobium sp. LSJC255A00]ESX71825.1 hypothetical protein X757_21625 [Mesorhizobium sp. LSHC414A00]